MFTKPNWDAAFGSVGGTAITTSIAVYGKTHSIWSAIVAGICAGLGALFAFTRQPLEDKP